MDRRRLPDLLGLHISHGFKALEDTFKRNKDLSDRVLAYSQESGDNFADVKSAIDKLNWVAGAYSRFDYSTSFESSHQKTAKRHMQVKNELGCSAGA